MNIVKKILLVVAMLATVAGFAGCNTVKGAGKDLQRGGEAIENAADRTAK